MKLNLNNELFIVCHTFCSGFAQRPEEHLGRQRNRLRVGTQGLHQRGQSHLRGGQRSDGRLLRRLAQHRSHLRRTASGLQGLLIIYRDFGK